MLVKTYGAAPLGIDAVKVTIEIYAVQGFGFTLVGLPDASVKESYERIKAAIEMTRISFPRRAFTLNLAPADIKKEGSAYDLPMAIGMLAGDEKVPTIHLEEYMMMGELSLDGSISAIKGVLPISLCARKEGFKGIIVPAENAREAAIVDGLTVYGVHHLQEVVDFLKDPSGLAPTIVDTQALFDAEVQRSDTDFSDVRGQENVRRAMEVAAAGGHNMLMVGPPGAGKSMMAKRLPTILPPLTLAEALETTKIHSVAGLLTHRKGGVSDTLIVARPFRSPHHTITDVALAGSGTHPQPGEISLAHNGVLFLDELPEYKRSAIEILRQPMEDRQVTIARAKTTVTYPASFMLVAAMNPCPCGHYGENNPAHPCTCTPGQIHRYHSKVSGPLLDRIDIHCEIAAVPYDKLRSMTPGESSAVMRDRVLKARAIQAARFAGTGIHCNAQMTAKQVRKYCVLDAESDRKLEAAMTSLGLSARAYDRILKVARTIADLDYATRSESLPLQGAGGTGAMPILLPHLLESLSYRALDRANWLG